MATTGVLPSYQRYGNGSSIPAAIRRSFRPKEKYLIGLVFITFVVVCFGAFFFLPEYKGGTFNSNVYNKFYEHLQNAPQLLIPPPPLSNDENLIGVVRHGDDVYSDPHRKEDQERLIAKIEEDEQQQKVLERPNTVPVEKNDAEENEGAAKKWQTPMKDLNGAQEEEKFSSYLGKGEEKDPINQERRRKVKEVGFFLSNLYGCVRGALTAALELIVYIRIDACVTLVVLLPTIGILCPRLGAE